MRQIAIIGAGQAGLQLGLGLLQHGYQVTLVSNRSADEILNGKIMSSQGMFDTALEYERKLGLNFWESQCPTNTSVTFTIADTDSYQKSISWKGFVDKPFQAVDQRMKFSYWLKIFEEQGGNLIIKEASVEDLESLAKQNALVIVAGGKGEISGLFAIDEEKSTFKKPMRVLACHYVNGMVPVKVKPGIHANIIPGIGEYFTMPGLTINGSCEMMLFEGIPGSPFDCWEDIASPEQQVENSLSLLKKYVPWEAERCKKIEITDNKASLIGRYRPVVRKPFVKLSSGALIFGMGDTVVLNDPIAGQGANNASKSAQLYMECILRHGKNSFDEHWMQGVFNEYWQHAQWATLWSQMLLLPPPPHIIDLLVEATTTQNLANKISNGFNDPSSLFPWIADPAQTSAMVALLKSKETKSKRTSVNTLVEAIHEAA